METATRFITAIRRGDLECQSSGIPRGMMAAAVTAALATCVLFFVVSWVSLSPPLLFARGRFLSGGRALGFGPLVPPLFRPNPPAPPPPYAPRSASNFPQVFAKPISATPKVPPGFEVELFVSKL